MAKVNRHNFIDAISAISKVVIDVSGGDKREAIIALGDVVNYVSRLESALDRTDGGWQLVKASD